MQDVLPLQEFETLKGLFNRLPVVPRYTDEQKIRFFPIMCRADLEHLKSMVSELIPYINKNVVATPAADTNKGLH
jgi:hypothetical protein